MPIAAARGIPWEFPEGDDSGVLISPWASIQITANSLKYLLAPEILPNPNTWSPPIIKGKDLEHKEL